MHPGFLALLLVVTPMASFAITPKPLASYCEQPEVIIPNVPQDQVLNDLTGRLRHRGTQCWSRSLIRLSLVSQDAPPLRRQRNPTSDGHASAFAPLVIDQSRDQQRSTS